MRRTDDSCVRQGVGYVLDNMCGSLDSVVVGIGKPMPDIRYLEQKRYINQIASPVNLHGGVHAMKERNVFTRCLVVLMLLTTVAVGSSILTSCASTRTHESTGEYVDDSTITTKVKALLAQDDFLKSFQISVETYKGTVQLSGFVNSQNAVNKAGEITRSVKGVMSVKNNLIVK
jgi:hypothetical protein